MGGGEVFAVIVTPSTRAPAPRRTGRGGRA